MGTHIGDRAIVLGGGIAGLTAANVLAEAYTEVLVVDRDHLTGESAWRRGAPQGRHINGLLARGHQALEELFPGITDELVADGVPLSDLSGTVRWYFNGRQLRQKRAGLTSVAATRPVMEAHIYRRVAALPNVEFVGGCDITGLATTPDRKRVTGVRVHHKAIGRGDEVLNADLVVDACGRGSRTHLWLAEWGYPEVKEEGTKIGLGYGTRHYRLRNDPLGDDVSIVSVASPELPRGAICTKTDGGRIELTTYGILGDHPPTDPEGYTEFVRSLATQDIYELIRDAEPLDDPVQFRFPTTLRRRYEWLNRFPDRLLVLGDAVCSPNPVFAQGQTLAALEALALRKHLNRGSTPDPRAFARDVGRVIDPAWEMTTSMSLTFPDVPGRRSLKTKINHAYLARIQAAATRDSRITAAFLSTAGLVSPPQSILRPGFVWRVLRLSRRTGRSAVARPASVST
ncbi:FAD-dependent oxidoreductase [Plantactinospora sp. GCM10030261]|uniref:FAD-dependent oxidoreductase n=1 Tax=Plantactinospora sp. GCM10030261 TaxID=3273420 RepID=UPI00361CC000